MINFFKKRPAWWAVLLSVLGISSCQPDDFVRPCDDQLRSGLLSKHIRGMSLVTAQSPIQGNPLQTLKALGMNSVALMPYCYYTPGTPTLDEISRCPDPVCPHGPSIRAGVLEALQRAKANDLDVLLKPQLWAAEEWVGQLQFSNEQDWVIFEQNYTNFIMDWVHVAAAHQVAYFCIGTELRLFVAQRPAYWQQLIAQIKAVYSGQLTYAANWDDYREIPFWKDLDFVGVDAYFPIDPSQTPSVCALREGWQSYKWQLAEYAHAQQRPILFTEFGYLSVDNAAYHTWNLEANIQTVSINERAQANALQALLLEWSQEAWWAGGFQWKWYADAVSAQCEWDLAKDYTPEGKQAEAVLQALYQE